MPRALLITLGVVGLCIFASIIVILVYWTLGKKQFKKHNKIPIPETLRKHLDVETESTPTRYAPFVTVDGKKVVSGGDFILNTDGVRSSLYQHLNLIKNDIYLVPGAQVVAVCPLDGTIAYVDKSYLLHIVYMDESKTIRFEHEIKHIQWDEDVLWISAFNSEQSGAIYSYQNGEFRVRVGPIHERHVNDLFGYHFHLNGNHLIVSHMLDRTAHVFKRTDRSFEFVPVRIIDPKRETSIFPHCVCISSDGVRTFLGNPTESIGNAREAGTVLEFDDRGKCVDLFTNGTSWFGRSISILGNSVLIQDDQFYYVYDGQQLTRLDADCASFTTEGIIKVSNGQMSQI